MVKYLIVFLVLVVGSFAAPNRLNSTDDQVQEGNWRVVGGHDAQFGAYPHQISLQKRTGGHFCGGSIVHQEWVITAAHCVVRKNPQDMVVLTGCTRLSDGGHAFYPVRQIHIPSDYDSFTQQNDIAFLRVAPIAFNQFVSPIAVEFNNVGGDELCDLSGWGKTSHPGYGANHLQEIELVTITVDECSNRLRGYRITDNQVCTFTVRGEGSCHGDSGGPLIQTNGGISRLIGVVSWGIPCADGYPDVFTRVSRYTRWLNEICGNCLGFE